MQSVILNWPDFKSWVQSRGLDWNWYIQGDTYLLAIQDGPYLISCTIAKTSSRNSDQIDFEDNYKSDHNKAIGQMTYSSDHRVKSESMIMGDDGNRRASVVDMGDGTQGLRTSSQVVVEELLGTLIHPMSFLTITEAQDGSWIQTDIPKANVSVRTDITPTEAGNLNAVAKKHESDLNSDTDFSNVFKAVKPTGSQRVVVQTKQAGDTNEYPDSGDFSVSTSAGAGVVVAYDNIIQRGVSTALFPHPDDPTYGTFAVTGNVAVQNKNVAQSIPQYLKDSQGSNDMRVNGSTTPVEFRIDALEEDDLIVTEFIIGSEDGNISFEGRYLDSVLNNGMLIEIESDDGNFVQFPPIKTTRDMIHLFSGSEGFKILQPNKKIIFTLQQPFILRGGTTDHISMFIRDDMSGYVAHGASVKAVKD